MDTTQALTILNITLGDAQNVTFTIEEKQRAITKAWNDAYVVTDLWDDSLVYSQSLYQYTLPNNFVTVQDIYLSAVNTTNPRPEPISSEIWELVAGTIQFNTRANGLIPNGYTLYLKGRGKLTTDDTIDSPIMQEYVLALAGYNTLTMLTHKKANLFVKNDTTMSELIGLRRELQSAVKELRAQLPKAFESV